MTQSSFKANMEKFMCINTDDDLYFQGTLISPVHNYLHFEILACDEEVLRKIPGYELESCFGDEQVERFFDNTFLLGYVENTFVD